MQDERAQNIKPAYVRNCGGPSQGEDSLSRGQHVWLSGGWRPGKRKFSVLWMKIVSEGHSGWKWTFERQLYTLEAAPLCK